MKLISLNTWDGKLLDPLKEFIISQKDSTDIFCLQEILDNSEGLELVSDGYRANLMDILKNILPNYSVHFYPDFEIIENGIQVVQGSTVWVKDSIKIVTQGHLPIYKAESSLYDPTKNHSAHLTFVELEEEGQTLHVFSYHGISFPGDKLDSQERITQSLKITEILHSKNGHEILTGDFNLMPETESIGIIEEVGMRNLIKEYEIKDTRGIVNARKYPESIQHFADYIFVSPEVEVKNFEVPQVEISDHLPLVLEFEI